MAHEHSFASPGPAGLGALAVACFGFGAVFLGLVKPGGLPLLAAWLIGGCLVQYTTAVMELKDHNITGGNVFLFFSAFFMLGAALSTLSKFLLLAGAGAFIPKAAAVVPAAGAAAGAVAAAVAPAAPVAAPVFWFPKPDAYIEGWMWMAGAGFLTAVTPAYAKSNALLFLMVVMLDIALWLIVGIDSGWFGNPVVTKPIVGWLLVICGWGGVYLAGATVCNTVYGRPMYWVPKPLVK
jgi:succinate-acetate transporter protein